MSPVYCIISSKWKTTGQTVTKSSIINEDQKLTPTKTEMKVRVVLALTSLTAYYVADVDFDGQLILIGLLYSSINSK